MILTYDEIDHTINIFGKSKNDAVDISPKILEMEPAYITLHTEKTIRMETVRKQRKRGRSQTKSFPEFIKARTRRKNSKRIATYI